MKQVSTNKTHPRRASTMSTTVLIVVVAVVCGLFVILLFALLWRAYSKRRSDSFEISRIGNTDDRTQQAFAKWYVAQNMPQNEGGEVALQKKPGEGWTVVARDEDGKEVGPMVAGKVVPLTSLSTLALMKNKPELVGQFKAMQED